MKKATLVFFILLAASFAAQLLFGAFPVAAFEFPVNAAVLFAGMAGLWVLFKEKPSCGLSRWLASGKTSVILLSVFLLSCLLLGLFSQSGPAELAAGYTGFAGIHDIVHSWWFVFIVTALLANLLMVIFTRMPRARFVLNHAGVFLAIAGGFFGAPDASVGRIPVYRDGQSREAFSMDGKPETLDYGMTMTGFKEEQDGNGSLQNYKAFVLIDNTAAEISVNHPYHHSLSEDIYLVSYDRNHPEPEYCVLEIVRQPWKYAIWAGIVMMMGGCLLMFVQGVKKKEAKI